MRDIWFVADSIVSPLGFTSGENYQAVRQGKSALRDSYPDQPGTNPVYCARLQGLASSPKFTRFESICVEAMNRVVSNLALPKDKTLFILSTTKGNIALLEQGQPNHERIHLHKTARHLSMVFQLPAYHVVSNACISGVMALIVAKRYLQSGKFDHAVILGADELSNFIISGFQSLQALSPEPCKPFDSNRKGVNLGECAAAIVLSAKPESLGVDRQVKITGGGLSNDANHISGPSRTGNELAFAIREALEESNTKASEIDFISAHGTATLYNDEMEAKAFYTAGMSQVPVNSMKGSFGHTLGAAGVLETVLSLHSLRNNEILPTVGFDTHGVSQPITINKSLQSRSLAACIKTASGFGGCNAAIVLQKAN